MSRSAQSLRTLFQKPLVRYSVLSIVFIFLFFTLRFASIYVFWSKQKSVILGKLIGYKKQLDFIRHPIKSANGDDEGIENVVAIPSRIYDRKGKLIGEYYAERRTLIGIDDVPKHYQDLLLANEDRNFESHKGIDYPAIFRAFFVNLFSLTITQGGSTITQQLAKVLFTDQTRTLNRKIYEYFCAREIERLYSKKEILEMYINLIYMGHGNYGLESASQFYFNKQASNLDLAESALIVSIIPGPDIFSPLKNIEAALQRQTKALHNYYQFKHRPSAPAKPLLKKFSARWVIRKKGQETKTKLGDFRNRAYATNLAPFYLEDLRNKLLKNYDQNLLRKGGLKISTTLDLSRQTEAKNQVITYLENLLSPESKIYFISRQPQTGDLTVFTSNQAISEYQDISKVKLIGTKVLIPLIYYLAISQKRVTPASLIGKDRKNIMISLLSKKPQGLAYLSNAITFDSLTHLSSEILSSSYRDLKAAINKKKLLTQSRTFTAFEVLQIYASFLNQGKSNTTRNILKIQDQKLRKIFADDSFKETEVLNETYSYFTIDLLKYYFQILENTRLFKNEIKALKHGIGAFYGNDERAKLQWFIGISPDEVSLLIVEQKQKPNDIEKFLARAYLKYLIATRYNRIQRDFDFNYTLENTVRIDLCLESGQRANKTCKIKKNDTIFLKGTEPEEY